jgi:FAD/FMN-containing dehydrogenase
VESAGVGEEQVVGVERRQFLRLVGVGAGAGVGGSLTGCAASGGPSAVGKSASARALVSSGSPRATSLATPANAISAAPASATAADWDALAQGLAGHLVRPGDGSYSTARLVFNPRFDGIQPAAVAQCRNADDVAECISFASRFRVPVVPRSGGHGYTGASSSTGLVIDVAAMNTVHADAASGTATVGAGAKLVDVYAGLAAAGVSIPAGSCPTVGIAGLALGGGVGVTGRMYGLTSDNLVGASLVTADGRQLSCDPTTHADLLWACQGGGGGNFGIATSFTFKTHPVADLTTFFLGWPWAQAVNVVRAWQLWAPGARDELWSNCHLLASPAQSGPKVTVGGTYFGDPGDVEGLLELLYTAVGSAPSSHTIEQATYAHAMGVEAGCASLTTAQCHLPWQQADGQLSREAELAKSDFFTTPLSTSAIGVIVNAVERRRALGGAGDGGIALDAFGGALNRPAPGETAFVHRDTLFLAQYTTTWATGTPSSVTDTHTSWLRGFYAALHPYASGQAYQNYLDADLGNWARAYYGANYPRLTQIKAEYDPDSLFRQPQGIGS